jgi:cytochrome c oxidase subunit II
MILGWLPKDISTFGPDIDSVISLIFYVVGAFFILAEAMLLAFVILYRRREGGRASFIQGESLRELAWVLVPVIIVIGFDVAIDVSAKPVWERVKMERPAAALTVKVAALQFGWEFTYPGPDGQFGTADDLLQSNTLTVPAGRVVGLIISSKDVIHSFYVPELRLKQDAVPGREIPAWFEATRPGKYEIACSQLCGISHFVMKGSLHVLTPEEYQQWISQHWPRSAGAAGKSASRAKTPTHHSEG